MMYAVVTYAKYAGIRSVDCIVDLCERDHAHLADARTKTDVMLFMTLKTGSLTSDVADDLNYQFMRRLQEEGLVTLKTFY